jgi:hypothetical protein
MAVVLTMDSKVSCPHKGDVSLASGAKLKVEGARVLVLAGVKGHAVSGCKQATSNSTKQCLNVVEASGTATKLTVGRQAVVLSSLTGTTDGAPILTATISVTDLGPMKLRAK